LEKIDVQIADRMSVETKITLGVDTHKDTHMSPLPSTGLAGTWGP
jgi:hypothetical protein